jgi:hypothetical protein
VVNISGIGFLPCGRADVTLLRPGIFLVDAFFNFCQQFDQLAPLGFTLDAVG